MRQLGNCRLNCQGGTRPDGLERQGARNSTLIGPCHRPLGAVRLYEPMKETMSARRYSWHSRKTDLRGPTFNHTSTLRFGRIRRPTQPDAAEVPIELPRDHLLGQEIGQIGLGRDMLGFQVLVRFVFAMVLCFWNGPFMNVRYIHDVHFT